jgi:hypothetical protein
LKAIPPSAPKNSSRLSATAVLSDTELAAIWNACDGRDDYSRIADVVSAEAARIAARKILAKVQLGQDPQADRQERRQRDVFSFAKVTADYLADKQGKVRPRTHVETTRYLTGEYFKPLHSFVC